MENRPIISIGGVRPAPGVDSEVWDRFLRWSVEVYVPMLLALPGRTGIDHYAIIKESAEYPSFLSLVHTESIKLLRESLKSPERTAVIEEYNTWSKRRVRVQIWSQRYALIRSFRSEQFGTSGKEDTKIENAPFMHLESFHLRAQDQDKYIKWLKEIGFISYIPVLMRLPGIKGYDLYQDVGYGAGFEEMREWDYPEFLSLLYFEDKKAFENYTKSPELLAYQKAIYNIFPHGLNFRWYVQYQLTKSWRK